MFIVQTPDASKLELRIENRELRNSILRPQTTLYFQIPATSKFYFPLPIFPNGFVWFLQLQALPQFYKSYYNKSVENTKSINSILFHIGNLSLLKMALFGKAGAGTT